MRKDIFKKKLINFIKKGTCSFTCVNEIKNMLDKNGYEQIFENNKWNLKGNKYYVIRNDASIVAFEIPSSNSNSFAIVTTHCDTPSLFLKPNGTNIKDNYLCYNVMPYGGLLNFGWLDHPLSLAGRIIIKKRNTLETKIVDFKKPLLIIPSVAIHQKAEENTNLDLNMQIDLQPILSLSKDKSTWDNILKDEIDGKIISYDLHAYSTTSPVLIGNNKELLLSPRIDNLTSVYAALESFIKSKSSNVKVFCSFNNEETGSLTVEGADSNFLLDMLKRISSEIKIDFASALANSLIVSSDNTHAIHPNHPEVADKTGIALLGKGLTIIKEEASTTNAITSAIIKTICDKYKIKYQECSAKNDITGGSTLSGISLRHVSVLSIDVGIPELSMHSSIETCAIDDVFELCKMMNKFYETIIEIKKGNIKIN